MEVNKFDFYLKKMQFFNFLIFQTFQY